MTLTLETSLALRTVGARTNSACIVNEIRKKRVYECVYVCERGCVHDDVMMCVIGMCDSGVGDSTCEW